MPGERKPVGDGHQPAPVLRLLRGSPSRAGSYRVLAKSLSRSAAQWPAPRPSSLRGPKAPCTAVELPKAFRVEDADGRAVSYVYYATGARLSAILGSWLIQHDLIPPAASTHATFLLIYMTMRANNYLLSIMRVSEFRST
jgi:hypothetical protein